MSLESLLQVLVGGVAVGSIYALVAQGFYITHRTTLTLNFGQGDFLMLGAFLGLTLVKAGVPIVLTALIVVAVLAALGVLLERVAIRPVGHLTLSWVLTTMGFGVIIQNVVTAFWGKSSQSFPSLVRGRVVDVIRVGGVGIVVEELFIIVASILIMGGYLFLLNRTLTGKALAAVAFNRDTAALLGVDVRRMAILVYVIAAILAAVSGILVGPITSVHPFMGVKFAIKGFAAGILGGFMSPVGIWVGGILLGVIELFSNLISSQFGDLYPFFIIILVLIFRPSGIFRDPTSK